MKTQKQTGNTNNMGKSFPSRAGKFQCATAAFAAATGILLTGQAALAKPVSQPVGAIFVIAMENHNFTQPTNQSSPPQIFANLAAPFINSLITPGNPNAAQVSYATTYYNAGKAVHPSEPSYVWAEAGTDFGFHSDADPKVSTGNIYTVPHLTAQLNAAGISWKNYQEDVQLSHSPTNSASGTNGPVNPYYGTTQYNYAAKHNPMAFFSDTLLSNVYPLAQLFSDLASNTVAPYNWITPNQFNDAHSTLNGGFTYQGTNYTGAQAAIAQGDNFLAKIIPQIMATPAYKNNGVIVIWWDESEGGDDVSRTIPEIIISPLAKGNAYASTVPMSHSSDIKTWEEIFGLPSINNPIPVNETNNFGGYENVATVNDLSDLFAPSIIPTPASLTVTPGNFVLDDLTGHIGQVVHIKNSGSTPVPAPLWLVLDNLSNATLFNADGTSTVLAPLGSPYLGVPLGDDNILRPHEVKTVVLEFADSSGDPISYNPRLLSVTPAP
jgi:hypothetical protein